MKHLLNESLKRLLGIDENDKSKDYLIDFSINSVSDIVKNYCHIDNILPQLENTLLNMAIVFYRNKLLGQESIENTVVSAIKEGDTNVTLVQSKMNDNGFLDDYKSQLNQFRRADW